jgi:hypothetical protein
MSWQGVVTVIGGCACGAKGDMPGGASGMMAPRPA